MADIVSELQTIEHEPKGELVRNAITSSLQALYGDLQNTANNAISSGEVYEMLHALRDAGEVRY